MSLLDRVKKLEKLKAINAATTITWVNHPSELTIEQIESKTDIYVYLEL
jgi:hypothetical protein